MPIAVLIRRAVASLGVLAASLAGAETWPGADWLHQPSPASDALQAFETYAFPARDDDQRLGVRSDAVVVIRDGVLVYERYAGETRVDTPHLAWSISKSLLATVLGVAYGEGRFHLDDPAARYYPPFSQHPQVTLRHLLNWSSGLAWEEDYEYAPLKSSVIAMLYTRGREDMAAFTASHRQGVAPGTHFRYSSGDSNVLAAALRGMVGAKDYPDYPWTALFEPLGIRSAVWERDAAGTLVASSYTYMNARDLARVGLLMQRDGVWDGRRLLPTDWLAFNRTPVPGYRPQPGDAVPGGHWWLNAELEGARPWPDAPAETFAALGHWGQGLYVLSTQKLVIVRFADDRDGSFSHNAFLRHAQAAFAAGEAP